MEHEVREFSGNSEREALTYAWEWFKYHAGQRQAVFRFYLLISGAIFTGFFASFATNEHQIEKAALLGLPLILASFLFWRLDARSTVLVKLAEAYLKKAEARLAVALDGSPADGSLRAIELAARADIEPGTHRVFVKLKLRSFREIYQIIFVLIGAAGLFIFVSGILNAGLEQ